MEGGTDKIWPVPIPDVAAGPEAGTILAGPGASSRAAAAMLSAGGGDSGDVITATGARVISDASRIRAATAALTSGALVPLEATAARHGYIPRSDLEVTPASRAHALVVTQEMMSGTFFAKAGGESTVLDHALSSLDEAAYADVAAAAQTESTLMRQTIESGELDALDLFWRRYNKALLEKLVLDKRRAQLKAENDELRAVLQQCMDGTVVSDRAMGGEAGNPLFIVNGRSGVTDVGAALMRTQAAAQSVNHAVTRINVDAGMTARQYAIQGRVV